MGRLGPQPMANAISRIRNTAKGRRSRVTVSVLGYCPVLAQRWPLAPSLLDGSRLASPAFSLLPQACRKLAVETQPYAVPFPAPLPPLQICEAVSVLRPAASRYLRICP